MCISRYRLRHIKLNWQTAVSVVFDELTADTVEVGFDVDGVSSGRTYRGINSVMLFQNIIWLIAEFSKRHGQIHKFKIIPPVGEIIKAELYKKISLRKEVIDFLHLSKLKSTIIAGDLYAVRI